MKPTKEQIETFKKAREGFLMAKGKYEDALSSVLRAMGMGPTPDGKINIDVDLILLALGE